MKISSRMSRLVVIGVAAVAITGCATHYDRKSSNTMLGAGLGAATGAVVSQGDPLFTIGGAAAGGILGNILTDDDRGDRRSRGYQNRGNRYDRGGRHRY
jgi:hypothetical protein